MKGIRTLFLVAILLAGATSDPPAAPVDKINICHLNPDGRQSSAADSIGDYSCVVALWRVMRPSIGEPHIRQLEPHGCLAATDREAPGSTPR